MRRHRDLSWDLTTTATTANQLIGSYTPEELSTFVVQVMFIEVYLITLSTTAALLGKLSIYYPKTEEYLLKNVQVSNTSSGALFGFPIQIPEGWYQRSHREELRAVCTPAVVTSIKWIVQLLGYDKL